MLPFNATCLVRLLKFFLLPSSLFFYNFKTIALRIKSSDLQRITWPKTRGATSMFENTQCINWTKNTFGRPKQGDADLINIGKTVTKLKILINNWQLSRFLQLPVKQQFLLKRRVLHPSLLKVISHLESTTTDGVLEVLSVNKRYRPFVHLGHFACVHMSTLPVLQSGCRVTGPTALSRWRD